MNAPYGMIVAGWLRGQQFIDLPEHARPTDKPVYVKGPNFDEHAANEFWRKRCIIMNARNMVKAQWLRMPAWGLVSHLFGVGSTQARKICCEANIDPDVYAKDIK